jgi:Rod binding domain-containing protein
MDVRTTQSLLPLNARQPHVAVAPSFALPGKSIEDAQTERLTHEAQRWVSQTFFGTLLKQMHDSPFKADWVSGGRGGEAFSTLYDQHLADRMARASGRQLVQSIVRQIQGRAQSSTTSQTKQVPPTNTPANTGRGHASTR